MIQEARRLHPSMLAVAVGFLATFLMIVVATVVSVLGDDMPAPASIDDLPLPAGIAVIDRQFTCTPDACDGEAAVVESPGMSAEGVLAMIEGRLKASLWTERGCADGTLCLGRGDLRARLVPWTRLNGDANTAAMRTHLGEQGFAQERLVFVHLYRCGVATPCE